jgi:hypothetical protein
MKTMMLAAFATLALTGAAFADGEQGPGWQQQQNRVAVLAQRAPTAVAQRAPAAVAQNGAEYMFYATVQDNAAAAYQAPNQGANS